VNVFVDLCSSLGGAAQAFDESSRWRTIKIDVAEYLLPHHRGLIISDVCDIERTMSIINEMLNVHGFERGRDMLVVWASPPCGQFSHVNAYRDPEDWDMSILEACLDIVDRLNPCHWVVENVRGAIEPFNDVMEQLPRQIIGNKVLLWGDFPSIAIHDRANFRHSKHMPKGGRLLRQHIRAVIPKEISQGLLSALECQTTLDRWS